MRPTTTSVSLDIASIWVTYLTILPPQLILDAGRINLDSEYKNSLSDSNYWRKALEYLNNHFSEEILKLSRSPIAITALVLASSIIFNYNTLRILSSRRDLLVTTNGWRLVRSIASLLIGCVLLTADIVDYMMIMVPLSIALGICVVILVSPKQTEAIEITAKVENIDKY